MRKETTYAIPILMLVLSAGWFAACGIQANQTNNSVGGTATTCDNLVDGGSLTADCSACVSCTVMGACLAESNACTSDGVCQGIITCAGPCNDDACLNMCSGNASAQEIMAFNTLSTCLCTTCPKSCGTVFPCAGM
jgi:hypothetical protein